MNIKTNWICSQPSASQCLQLRKKIAFYDLFTMFSDWTAKEREWDDFVVLLCICFAFVSFSLRFVWFAWFSGKTLGESDVWQFTASLIQIHHFNWFIIYIRLTKCILPSQMQSIDFKLRQNHLHSAFRQMFFILFFSILCWFFFLAFGFCWWRIYYTFLWNKQF